MIANCRASDGCPSYLRDPQDSSLCRPLVLSRGCKPRAGTAAAGILLFIRIENPEGGGAPVVFFAEENLSVSCSDLHPIRLCTCASVSSFLPSTSRIFSFSPPSFLLGISRRGECRARPDALRSLAVAYASQEVLSSRFCIFLSTSTHMPLSISERVLGSGTSHATSLPLRDVSLIFPSPCLSQLPRFSPDHVSARIFRYLWILKKKLIFSDRKSLTKQEKEISRKSAVSDSKNLVVILIFICI